MNHHAANPAPAGLVAYAAICYIFAAINAGIVGTDGLFLTGCWLMGGFAVQIIASSKEIEQGSQLGGNVFLFFQGFFMLTGGLGSMFKYLCLYKWDMPYNTTAEGFGWLACTLAMILWTPGYFKTSNKVFTVSVVFTDIALIGTVLNDLHILGAEATSAVKIMIAIGLAVAGTLGLYVATAMQLNHCFEKEVLPLGEPFLKSKKESVSV